MDNVKIKQLDNKIIGISIAESDDSALYGFGMEHLQDILIETARYLLAAGAKIAYGGNLKHTGGINFLTTLLDLLRQHTDYNPEDPPEKIINYVSYPLFELFYTVDIQAEHSKIVTFKRSEKPADFNGNAMDVFKKTTPYNHFIYAQALTFIRRQMAEDCDVRILLGGKNTRYSGKYPGLLEEACMHLKAGKPLFLIGAFGGCTRVIIRALQGEKPEELTEDYQFRDKKYKKLYEYYNAHVKGDEKIDYSKMVEFLNNKGVKSLHNGLSAEENEVLFSESDSLEIVRSILKGIKQSG